MKSFALVVLLMILSMFTHSAHARKPKAVMNVAVDYVNKPLLVGATVWYCAYDGGDAVQCLLGEAGDNISSGQSAQIDSRLPEIVRKVWTQASELVGKIIRIPLHTIPFDMELTGELAHSVMCGGATMVCGVLFANDTTKLSQLVETRSLQLAVLSVSKLAMN